MYKRVRLKKLGRKKSHRESMIENQIRSIFSIGYVKTTSVKAGVLKSKIEKLMSDYSEDLSFRRKIREVLGSKQLVENFVNYVKKENKGVKIVKLGFRPGDMSEVSRVELINFKEKKAKKEMPEEKKKEKKKDKTENKREIKREPMKVAKPEKVVVNKERAKSRSGL